MFNKPEYCGKFDFAFSLMYFMICWWSVCQYVGGHTSVQPPSQDNFNKNMNQSASASTLVQSNQSVNMTSNDRMINILSEFSQGLSSLTNQIAGFAASIHELQEKVLGTIETINAQNRQPQNASEIDVIQSEILAEEQPDIEGFQNQQEQELNGSSSENNNNPQILQIEQVQITNQFQAYLQFHAQIREIFSNWESLLQLLDQYTFDEQYVTLSQFQRLIIELQIKIFKCFPVETVSVRQLIHAKRDMNFNRQFQMLENLKNEVLRRARVVKPKRQSYIVQ